jgi:predicted small lipoprotein YifL
MRNMTTALAAAFAMLALAACAKKEEMPPSPADAAPTEALPADANSEDAEQSGGDKVKQ